MKNLLICVSVLTFLVLVTVWINKPTATVAPPPKISKAATDVFNLVQEWRVENGYPRYENYEPICDLAVTRAKEAHIEWSHRDFHNMERLNSICPVSPVIGCRFSENLITHFSDPEEILSNWLKSPSHKENLVDNYKYSCIAEIDGIYAHIFADF